MKKMKKIILILILSLSLIGTMGSIHKYHEILPVIRLVDEITINEYEDNFSFNLQRSGMLFINNKSAENPTYDEMMKFILEDDTDKLEYIPDVWNCLNYANQVHNRAEEKGIKCGLVEIAFKNDKIRHAFNVFNTTDEGLIYVDCTGTKYKSSISDKIVYVELNKNYCGYYLYNNNSFETNSTISVIDIYF